ncbi:hypothetical protein D6C99_10115 [Aureobasidium pullulans]|nr:hypothetical protein D6C99_10115 [Aureobasidium pullulans]
MIRCPARRRLHATLALAALPEAEARSAPLPIVLPGNDNASDDKQVFTTSKRPKAPKTPKAIAKGSNKLQAKPLKSDDGEEEEEVEEVEEVEDGSVKVKEESLQLLKTTLERLRNSEWLKCDSQLVHRHDGTNSEIAVCLSPFFPSRVAGVVADLATSLVVFNAPTLVQILEAPKALGLGTQREVISTRLQALKVRLTQAPTADGASSIEFDDRLMPANDYDDQQQYRTPDRCLCQEAVEACSLQMSSPEDWSAIEAR